MQIACTGYALKAPIVKCPLSPFGGARVCPSISCIIVFRDGVTHTCLYYQPTVQNSAACQYSLNIGRYVHMPFFMCAPCQMQACASYLNWSSTACSVLHVTKPTLRSSPVSAAEGEPNAAMAAVKGASPRLRRQMYLDLCASHQNVSNSFLQLAVMALRPTLFEVTDETK